MKTIILTLIITVNLFGQGLDELERQGLIDGQDSTISIIVDGEYYLGDSHIDDSTISIGQNIAFFDDNISYGFHYEEEIIKILSNLLNEYADSCYADSSYQQDYRFVKVILDSAIILTAEGDWIHKEPTFKDFIEWLNRRRK